MSVVADRFRGARRSRAGARPLASRLLAAVPLLSVFAWLCLVYFWEAWRHGSPWNFSDELEYAQLSRAIAETGHAARRGELHPAGSLYSYMIAPAWWIASTETAYATIKYLNVLVMTAAAFPAYGLARLVAGPRLALFAATGTAAVPALAYSSFIGTEVLAYPYSTLCLFLIAKALITRSPWWIGGAVVASLGAGLIRGELALMPGLLALAALLMLWSGDRVRAWWSRWSVWDWVGWSVLVLGAIFLFSGLFSHRSYTWYVATYAYKDRMLKYGLWAAGALVIGMGVLPAVAGLASLVRERDEERTTAVRAFRSVFLAAIVCFGLYTAVKAAYVSTVFATRVEERNIFYLAPAIFAGAALWLERRRLGVVGLAAATAFVGYLIVSTPYFMDREFYGDAPGLAILEQANRHLFWTPTVAHWFLIVSLAVTVPLLLAPRLLASRNASLAGWATGVVAVLAVAWSLTGQVAAATGSNDSARAALTTLGPPATWVDDHTKGGRVVYLGQGESDQNSEWLLEFWNRSIAAVWSLDGTVKGPGPYSQPNLDGTNGLLTQPGVPYAVVDPGIDVAGDVVATHKHRAGGGIQEWKLVRIDPPFRLRAAVTGIAADGWSGPGGTTYTEYSTPGKRAGWLTITVSRAKWGNGSHPDPVAIKLGTLVIGDDKQPHIGRVTQTRSGTIDQMQTQSFTIPTPRNRFRAEVSVGTFQPIALNPAVSTDNRELGAVVAYRFSEKPPRHR